MPAKISPEERLLGLVVALTSTGQGLTKEAILQTVSGYREALEAGSSRAAVERMFERDKEDLRTQGVPIQTIGDPTDPDDLRGARYRVPDDEYALPDDVSFTPAELLVLRLAGQAWSASSLSSDAQGALRKLGALGIDVDESLVGFAPRVAVPEPSFAPLERAIADGRIVTFDYVRGGSARARRRRVSPRALVEYEGRWHVFGFDHGVDAERIFLLSRIVGDVEDAGADRFSSNDDASTGARAGERALAGLRAFAAENVALLEVAPGTEAALRLGRRGIPAVPQGTSVSFVDLEIFADELASYGPEVRVVDPPALRDAVIERLRRVRDLHANDQIADTVEERRS